MCENLKLKVISWNIRSFRKRYINILHYVKKEKPHIICVQEALHGHDSLFIRGFSKYVHDTKQGLITFINNNVPHEFTENSPSENGGNSYMLFKINIDKPFYMCNVYIECNKFDEGKLPHPMIYEDIIFAGDFNARHNKLSHDNCDKINHNGKKLITFISDNNMQVEGTRIPTHIKGGRLDYFIISGLKDEKVNFQRIDHLLSDHYAIEIEIIFNILLPPLYERKRINIPVEFVAPFRDYMSRTFHDANIEDLTGQDINDRIIQRVHMFHEMYFVNAPNRLKAKNWTEDIKLKNFEKNLYLSLQKYRDNANADNLHEYMSKLKEYRELKSDVRLNHFYNFLQSINEHTKESKVWQSINLLLGKKRTTPQKYDSKTVAEGLLEQYSLTSTFTNLPHDVKLRLEELKFDRLMRIEIACEETLDPRRLNDWISQNEIDVALSHGKSSAPGEDGITYQVIRYLNGQICNGINPLQLLFTKVYREGILPKDWKFSIIFPIPKQDSNQLRPISLTSCLSKVFERILLNRLQFTINDKLSDNLYGFINGRSTKDCFIKQMHTENHSSVTVFLDLKSAFDIANRVVILDHLAALGVKGNLLQLIKSYFTDRNSKVYYKGYLTPNAKLFELGTPQGGVLSPLLFNVLMDKLLKSIKLPNNQCTIICYADDICIRAPTANDMQMILDQFSEVAKNLGLIVSVPKTKYVCKREETLNLELNRELVEKSMEYKYLGIPTPFHINEKENVKMLCTRLSKRLRPLRVLANRIEGVNINMCRTFYIAYIRSVVDYYSLHLCSLNFTTLKPLETIQNEALRIILGCPKSTRVISMQIELNLPPLLEYIRTSVITYGVKIAKFQGNNINNSNEGNTLLCTPSMIRSLIQGDVSFNDSEHPKIFQIISNGARKYNINLFSVNETTPIGPCDRIKLETYIPNLPSGPECSALQRKNLWIENLNLVIDDCFSNVNALCIYTDGSHVSSTGKTGCGMVVYDKNGSKLHEVSIPMPKWTSVTKAELCALKLAIEYAGSVKKDALICSDSLSAILSLNTIKSQHSDYIDSIQLNAIYCFQNNVKIQFMWVPSHIGIKGNEYADKLAKAATLKNCTESSVFTLAQFKTIVRNDIKDFMQCVFDNQRCESISIKHYDNFKHENFLYGKGKLHTGPCDRLAARIRLGYRNIWEIRAERNKPSKPEFSCCTLCEQENSNTLYHYILFCPKLKSFRPKGKLFIELCHYFCKPENLYAMLSIYPGLKM